MSRNRDWRSDLNRRAAELRAVSEPELPAVVTTITPTAGKLAERIRAALADAGDDGLTAEQIADAIGGNAGHIGNALVRSAQFERTGVLRSVVPGRKPSRGKPSTVWRLATELGEAVMR